MVIRQPTEQYSQSVCLSRNGPRALSGDATDLRRFAYTTSSNPTPRPLREPGRSTPQLYPTPTHPWPKQNGVARVRLRVIKYQIPGYKIGAFHRFEYHHSVRICRSIDLSMHIYLSGGQREQGTSPPPLWTHHTVHFWPPMALPHMPDMVTCVYTVV